MEQYYLDLNDYNDWLTDIKDNAKEEIFKAISLPFNVHIHKLQLSLGYTRLLNEWRLQEAEVVMSSIMKEWYRHQRDAKSASDLIFDKSWGGVQ